MLWLTFKKLSSHAFENFEYQFLRFFWLVWHFMHSFLNSSILGKILKVSLNFSYTQALVMMMVVLAGGRLRHWIIILGKYLVIYKRASILKTLPFKNVSPVVLPLFLFWVWISTIKSLLRLDKIGELLL